MKRLLRKCIFEIRHAVLVGKNYGFRLGLNTFLSKFLLRDPVKYKKFKECHQEDIRRYLYDKYFRKIVYQSAQSEKQSEDSPIWVMWWQGEEHMPETVKMCVYNIHCMAGKHPVHMITEKNYRQFTVLPDYIQERLNQRVLTVTHLSDIIRFSLLHTWGGVWIDATMYLTEPLKKEVFAYPLYTIKHGLTSYLCGGLWSGFFFAGEKHNAFFKWVLDFLLAYWKNEKVQIDYFLIDDIIMLGYRHIKEIHDQIEAIPMNNCNVLSLDNLMNCDAASKLPQDTYLFKLSWKKVYKKEINGHQTLYAKLLEQSQRNCFINFK